MRNFLFLNFAEALKRREYVGWSLRLQKILIMDRDRKPPDTLLWFVTEIRKQTGPEEYTKYMYTESNYSMIYRGPGFLVVV
jgi:hypothetical protein